MKLGLLLPHFGQHGDPELLITGAKRAEALGFDSLWVRDHIVFEPHGEFEEPSRRFLEALTTLTAIGASTSRIGLGTGSLIPFRNPLTTALTISSMSQFFPDRLTIGIGAGNSDEEFAAVGLAGVDRRELVLENIEVLRALWTGGVVSHHGATYDFEHVALDPAPVGEIPIWYCGNTPASVRRAVAACDGWLPGRVNLPTLQKRVGLLRELAEVEHKTVPSVGIIPAVSIDRDRERALSRVNVNGLLAWANHAKMWVKPESGSFERLEDLVGVLLAGSPDDVIEGCHQLGQSGVAQVVFDLRMDFGRWLEQVELLGEAVLPQLN